MWRSSVGVPVAEAFFVCDVKALAFCVILK